MIMVYSQCIDRQQNVVAFQFAFTVNVLYSYIKSTRVGSFEVLYVT